MLCKDPFSQNLPKSQSRADRYVANVLKDDVQVLSCLDKTFVFDDIGMLDLISSGMSHVRKEPYVEILEQVDLRLQEKMRKRAEAEEEEVP